MSILVFDTETTGLPLHPDAPLHKQPKIIELGAMMLDKKTGAVLRELSQLINPGEPVSAEITKITGITNEQLVGQPTFAEFLPQLREFFLGANTLVAHNAPFDKGLLQFELARLHAEDFPMPEKTVCTVGLYKDAWGRNPRLIELYERVIGTAFIQEHRALSDVAALVEIIRKDQLLEVM